MRRISAQTQRDSFFSPRPGADSVGERCRGGLREHARTGASCRTAGISPLLARRTSQHGWHRQRRHQRPHWTRRAGYFAEQFGTLESLYPGRIDLGLGRAPGTDRQTARALRRHQVDSDQRFPHDVIELQGYFRPTEAEQTVRAIPGAGLGVPIWLLGSSLFSAQLAAHLGLPYAFASHFAPDLLAEALDAYRSGFRASEQLERPYAMVGINVVAADSDAEAAHLFTSQQVQSVDMIRGRRCQLVPPIDDMETYWTGIEKPTVEHKLTYSFVGSAETVRKGVAALVADTQADEIIATARIFDPSACLRSLQILAGVRRDLAADAGTES